MKKLFFIVFVFIVFVGCKNTCLRVDGEYKDYKGGFEYCFDAQKSTENDTPTLLDSEGKESYLIDESLINKINELLPSTKAKNFSKKKKPVVELLEKIRNWKK